MIGLKNAIDFEFQVAAKLKNRLFFRTALILTEEEKDRIVNATQKIADQMTKEGKTVENLPYLYMFFTEDGNVDFSYTSDPQSTILGFYIGVISVAVEHLRKMYTNPDRYRIMFELTVIEELCHAIWQVHDEGDVKRKVYEVYYIYTPNPPVYDTFFDSLYTPEGKAK